MKKISYSSMLVTAGACLLFPILIPMALGLAAYVAVGKTRNIGNEGPKGYKA
jgi:hypothetical protein